MGKAMLVSKEAPERQLLNNRKDCTRLGSKEFKQDKVVEGGG